MALLAIAPVLVVGVGAGPADATVPVQDEPPATFCEPLDEEVPFQGTDWARERLNVEKAWPYTHRGAGVRVAVIDTGVSVAHPQLVDAVDQASALNLYDGDAVPATGDCSGHGTGVAGIIAGREDPAYSSFVGVAPEATIIPIRVTISEEESPKNEVLAEAVEYAVAADADVINISFESAGAWPRLRQAISDAIAQDVVVVAASGNHGNRQAYPAAYPGVIGVGATMPNGTIAAMSGYKAPVSVVAPGYQLAVPWPPGGHTVDAQGTSFAAPYVSGVAALLIDQYDGDITPAEVKRRIELTADESGHDLPDDKYGWGVVNPYAAVTEMLPEQTATEQNGKRERVLPILKSQAPPDHTVRNAAVAVTVGGIALVLLTIGGVSAYRRGRARGWRPGLPQASDQP